MERKIEVYSEKLGKTITVSDGTEDIDENIVFDDDVLSMAGWVHNGWNNDNGGAGW